MKDEITASIEELESTIQEHEKAQASQQEEKNPSASQEEQADIPEKFKGKSAAEIAKAYSEAEKHMHEVSSDRSYLKRKVEEQEQRLAELQSQLNSRSQPVVDEDPLSSFDESFDEDPKEAIKQTLKKTRDEIRREKEALRKAAMQDESKKLFEAKSKDKDFVERQPLMAQTIQRYAHLLRPEMLEHPDTIEVLDTLTRGLSVDKYVKAAEERASKQRETIREEKRSAFSESSSAQGNTDSSDDEDFMSLSYEEQEKHLRRLSSKISRSGK